MITGCLNKQLQISNRLRKAIGFFFCIWSVVKVQYCMSKKCRCTRYINGQDFLGVQYLG